MANYLTEEQRVIQAIAEWVGGGLIGDDCALVSGQTLLTSDSLVEGTHFLRPLMSLDDIGWKAAAVNLSDVAAMAGRPRYLLVAATVPHDFGLADFRQLFAGIGDCARAYRTRVAGGDVTHGPCLMLTLTVVGEVHEEGCLKRSGARSGDVVVVTGDFGASRAGLWLLQARQPGGESKLPPDVKATSAARLSVPQALNFCIERHVKPKPKLEESWQLVGRTRGAGALMDASDGLADAIVQIGRASNVGMEIDTDRIPIHEATRKVAAEAGVDPLHWALYGGEDYELVACLAQDIWKQWQESSAGQALPFKEIGRVTEEGDFKLMKDGKAGPELDLSQSFQHLKTSQ
ncbi:MAG TPA: thiamine-phosphate kinase [Candidatus Obscuribacterales bacterium]